MSGQNAFAYTGAAFVPTNRNSTASLKVRPSGQTSLTGVLQVYKTSPSLTSIWDGYPPVVESFSVANSRTGTFPNLANSIVLSWTLPNTSLISGFDIFYDAGAGFTKINGSLVSKSSTSYTVGFKPAGTHRFYVKSVGVNGVVSTTSVSEVTIPSSGTVSVLSSSKTTTSATVSWTVTAGTFQRFHIYDNATYLGEVLATDVGTSYSYTRTGLSQTTSYNFRVYAQNYDGIFGALRETNVTTNTLPIPSISWSDSSSTKYSDWSITWAGTTGITYQPQYYVSSWLNNGSTLSGSGTKTSPTRTVGYGSTLYMRVYVTDAYGASGYTSQIQVTAGRPLATETSWKETSTMDYTATYNAQGANWGDQNVFAFTCNSNTDFRFNTTLPNNAGIFSIVARPLNSPAKALTLSSSTTAKNRRAGYRNPDGQYEIFSFDDDFSQQTVYAGVGSVGSDWHTSIGGGAATYYFGVSDMPTYFDSNAIAWRYANGTIDNWNLGAQTEFTITVNASRRDYTTTTTQTQVNSTYA